MKPKCLLVTIIYMYSYVFYVAVILFLFCYVLFMLNGWGAAVMASCTPWWSSCSIIK